MRSWHPILPKDLDDKALRGEHAELHGIGSVIHKSRTGMQCGYQSHPEVLRWKFHTKALRRRHNAIAREMLIRGFNHWSDWPNHFVFSEDTAYNPNTIEPVIEMRRKLRDKIASRVS